jgi:hypothetical protein
VAADPEELQKLVEASDQMLDHYCAEDRTDDSVAEVMRETHRQLEERLRKSLETSSEDLTT